MSEPRIISRVLRQCFLAFFFIALLGYSVLPTPIYESYWTPPDFMMILILFWLMRRPDDVSPFLVFTLFLLADALLQRPLGLMSGTMFVAVDLLKKRLSRVGSQTFGIECVVATVFISAIMLTQITILTLVLTPHIEAAIFLAQGLATCLVYLIFSGIGQIILPLFNIPLYKRR